AVEDAHQALSMTDQLADPAMVERRLDVLHGVNLGQKASERLSASAVAFPGRGPQKGATIGCRGGSAGANHRPAAEDGASTACRPLSQRAGRPPSRPRPKPARPSL